MAPRTRASRASSTASGNSMGERAIRPRRISDFEQFPRRAGQSFGTGFGYHDGIAEYEITHLGVIGVGMNDERHARHEQRVHILQKVRFRIAKQAKPVAA